ncbi:MAG: Rieske 2Fe-2S domain-containing protein [Dehalococcoidia bacterium]
MAELEGYVRVMPEADIAEGQLYGFEVDDELRILTRVEGEILALYGICSHEYAELVEGEVDEGILWCPLHSSGFDVHTGKATNLPAVLPIDVYDVRIEDGQVYVSVMPKDAADGELE